MTAATLGVCCAQEIPVVRESVVVTGSYEPLSVAEMDRAITLLPARDQALLLNGLVDVLRQDPSLDVRQRAPGGVQADLSIRGSGFGQTLVLLNGQRMNDAQTGHHNMDIPVPLTAVTQIEVLRGSGSTAYGSDAIAGVVNIITAPPESPEIRLRGGAGNFGTNVQSGSLAGALGPISQQVSFAREFSTGFRPNRDYRNLQFSSLTRVSTSLGSSDLTLAYMDRPFGADQFYGNFNSWEDTKTWFASARQEFGERTTASFSFRRHSDLFVLYRDRPSVFTNRHTSASSQAALRRREPISKAVSISYGVEALHESLRSGNLGNHARTRGAAYAALDLRALRRFSLSLAAREEVHGGRSGEFSPTVAGGVWLSAQWKLRASASRAFRIPSYTELYYQDPGNRGSPDLRPERAWTYEGGVDWNPAGAVGGSVTVFTRRERDGIDYYRASPGEIWRAMNIQSLNFTGVETSLRLAAARRHTVDLRYTALRGVHDTVPDGYTKYTFSYPRHSGSAEWRASLPGGVAARSRVGAYQRRGKNPYPLWDVSAALTRGSVRPFLQLANMTSTSYEEIPGVIMPGRTVLGGVELVWPAH